MESIEAAIYRLHVLNYEGGEGFKRCASEATELFVSQFARHDHNDNMVPTRRNAVLVKSKLFFSERACLVSQRA